jgi:hypothetical protein
MCTVLKLSSTNFVLVLQIHDICLIQRSDWSFLLIPFALFILAIVLSVLRYTDSDYPFGIFKFFLQLKKKAIQYDLCTPIR